MWNVRSMLDLNRRTVLSNALALQHFHIISLCETWLVDTIPNSGLFLGNRSIFRRDRQPKRTGKSSHGGVLIAVDSSIPCKEITEFNVFEGVVGSICHFCSVHLLVLSVYCPLKIVLIDGVAVNLPTYCKKLTRVNNNTT